MHNALHQGILSVGLTRAIGDDRGAAGIERYGETLTPTIDLWQQPEWAFLRAERLCAIFRTEGAVAGEFSAVGVLNPAGSNLIAVLEAVSFDLSGAGLIFSLQRATEAQVATLATVASGNVLDGRWLPAAQTRCNVVSGTDASSGIGVSIEQRRTPGNTTTDFRHLPMVLNPGMAGVAVCLTVNTAITVNLKWRERHAFPGELE